MSFTTVIVPVLSALLAAGKFIGPDASWNPINKQQDVFINKYFPLNAELKKFSTNELKSCASRNHKELEDFLHKNGFPIIIKPFGPDEFGTASVFKILVKWIDSGTATTITSNGKEYPAVMLENNFTLNSSDIHNEPVLKMTTQNGDLVYMTVADNNSLRGGLELLQFAQQVSAEGLIDVSKKYDKTIYFPMVDIDQNVDISWLKGMYANDVNETTVVAAYQKTLFQMNEIGAAAQSAVHIRFRETSFWGKKTTFIIDKPFYLWIMRPGITIPLFAAYIDVADWKKPAKLNS